MYTFLIYTLFCLITAWFLGRWNDRKIFTLASKVTTIKWQLWLGFGYILSTKGTVKTFHKIIKTYGKNVLIYVGPFPTLMTADPVVIKDVLTSKQCVQKVAFFYERLSQAMGRGLITLNAPDWYTDRKIMNAAFSNKNLITFIPIFNDVSKNLLKYIDRDMVAEKRQPLIDYFRRFTMEIALRTTIGRDVNQMSVYDEKYSNIAAALEYLSATIFNLWLFNGLIRKLAQLTIYKTPIQAISYIKAIIAESLNSFTAKREVDPSYVVNINTVMDYVNNGIQKNTMEEKHAVDGLFHIFAGAFETTSTSLYFIIIMLAMHPEYQERAYEEVRALFPDEDDSEGEFEVGLEHLSQLVYLDMVIKETMRILPIIPHVARMVSEKNLELSNGVILPKGQSVIIDIFSLHRSKEIWGPNAEQFNPDNFLPSNMESKHAYAYIPFTKGVRFCIGMRYAELSIKLALVKLIRRYSFSTTADLKIEDLNIENHISSQLTNHPSIQIQRRL